MDDAGWGSREHTPDTRTCKRAHTDARLCKNVCDTFKASISDIACKRLYNPCTHTAKTVSPWHEIPLHAGDGNLHYICEIPKETSAKMEVATVSRLRLASPLYFFNLSGRH